ncbi:HyaD/HybD family hydrogenase maturation endopeptidase [Caldichromatium japonicum]|uniref:HyaD/HybD family hydrogenase maturation endopeptidase n=1 Tax=Caldichromatium japonicum TaxID=2699430 RepID=A0A6G7VEP2_9GAMM|nr:HyaD/HybD family hydrogenase maturation endopeptidase [Caldichromatium japonicum]QIK38509.1 HyaD/HybD family hydrogenase maturation endopeptidase [Caldichromatium japonicum]
MSQGSSAQADAAPATGSGATPQTKSPPVLLLGIGNLLWADEGFGVRVVEEIARRYRLGPNVQVVDGGTQGLYLLDLVHWAEILVVFDAIDYDLPPGTLKRIEGEDVPRFLGVKRMSLHQTGFQEVLGAAQLLGEYPKHLLLIGVQPVELDDFGGELTAPVKKQIEPAIALARAYLEHFGVIWEPLGPTETAAQGMPHRALLSESYELLIRNQ